MSADHVLLFILLWTFTAVCQAFDDEVSVSCDDVTGSVGEEVHLTCSVSLKRTECCIRFFEYYEIYKHSTICMEELPHYSCEQRNSFTCSYTSTTATTEQFRFFLRTTCGWRTTEFTVDIEELWKQGTETEAPGKRALVIEFIVITGVSCFIIIIVIIVIVTCVKRLKNTNPSGLQKRYERGASEEQTVMTTNV